ncbi:MAG: hypothetical protein IT516_05855 [Burkholderiales bacterium]|nr:hypothetical protein [Burkholderiales bacterium]
MAEARDSTHRFLGSDEKAAIAARVAALEEALGIEIVTVVSARSDAYPEVVWKAFAVGTAFAALALAIGDLVQPDWVSGGLVLTSLVVVLATGALAALAAAWVPAFGRLFLNPEEAQAEVMQRAHDQFLERELFTTPERTALLIMVSLFERRVVVLPDKGLRALAGAAQWRGVVERMTHELRRGATGAAVLAGLDAVHALLAGKPIARTAANVFADAPVIDRRSP